MTQYFILLVSTAIVLLGAALFTNGLEWFGKKLNYTDRAVGSIFAAIGSAMPETIVPIIAILYGAKTTGAAVGVGAIIGAPFMLATLAMFVTGVAVVWNKDKRSEFPKMNVATNALMRDLECFMAFYGLAIAASFTDIPMVKMAIAGLLLLFYAVYALYALRSGHEEESGENNPEPCWFSPKSKNPPLYVILTQVALALVLIIWGAQLFVDAIQSISIGLGVSPLILSLIIVPIATELPEKFNSVIWVSRGKDTLALGNVTGSMVWQSSVIVVVGILLTEWKLGYVELLSAVFTMLSAGLIYLQLRWRKKLTPAPLLAGGMFYVIFMLAIIFGGAN